MLSNHFDSTSTLKFHTQVLGPETLTAVFVGGPKGTRECWLKVILWTQGLSTSPDGDNADMDVVREATRNMSYSFPWYHEAVT